MIPVKRFHVKMTFTERLLGSSPMDKEVYKTFIATHKEKAKDQQPLTSEQLAEEVDTLPTDREEVGWSCFHSDEQGLFIFDYQLRGFLKEAWSAISSKGADKDLALTAGKSKVDKFLFIRQRRVRLMCDGANVMKPEGVFERPLRAMTMQGPRVSLKRSDYLAPGVYIEFDLEVLPLGTSLFTNDLLSTWFEYGRFQGMGEWRNGSNGRFDFELTEEQ